MSTLHIDLQDGFTGDDVRVAVNGRDAYGKQGVTTNILVGLAATIRVTVEDGPATVEITVPSRHLVRTERVEVQGDTYLGVSVLKTGITVTVTKTPFGYA